MATHELKTWSEPFEAVWRGDKTAEFRRDDREPPFKVGDWLHLREWNHEQRYYTGRMVAVQVSDIRRSGLFGIPERYAMISFRSMTRYPKDQD